MNQPINQTEPFWDDDEILLGTFTGHKDFVSFDKKVWILYFKLFRVCRVVPCCFIELPLLFVLTLVDCQYAHIQACTSPPLFDCIIEMYAALSIPTVKLCGNRWHTLRHTTTMRKHQSFCKCHKTKAPCAGTKFSPTVNLAPFASWPRVRSIFFSKAQWPLSY
jgi:hypothetical protein